MYKRGGFKKTALTVSDKGGGGCVPKFSVQMHTNWQWHFVQ